MNKLKQLKKPFKEEKVKWRIQRAGKNNNGLWAIAVAYVDARTVMDRLDDVLSANNWQDKYLIKDGAYSCELSIKYDDEWIKKSGVSGETNIEASKGGASGAFKRAGVKHGIARYLYHLDEDFVDTSQEKKDSWNQAYLKQKNSKNIKYWWKEPELPNWALPYSWGIEDRLEEYELPKEKLLSWFTDKADKFGDDNPVTDLNQLPKSWLKKATTDRFWEDYKEEISKH